MIYCRDQDNMSFKMVTKAKSGYFEPELSITIKQREIYLSEAK